jgi:hypothetical protein
MKNMKNGERFPSERKCAYDVGKCATFYLNGNSCPDDCAKRIEAIKPPAYGNKHTTARQQRPFDMRPKDEKFIDPRLRD